LAPRIICIGARFFGYNGGIPPLNGGKNTIVSSVVSPEVSALFSIICAVILLYKGAELWGFRMQADSLYGILREQALNNLRPRERALCLPGLGCCIGVILFWLSSAAAP